MAISLITSARFGFSFDLRLAYFNQFPKLRHQNCGATCRVPFDPRDPMFGQAEAGSAAVYATCSVKLCVSLISGTMQPLIRRPISAILWRIRGALVALTVAGHTVCRPPCRHSAEVFEKGEAYHSDDLPISRASVG